MHLSEQLKNNTLLALISGSFVLQVLVLLVALGFKLNTAPTPGSTIVSSVKISNAPLTEDKPLVNMESVKQAPVEKKEKITTYKIVAGDTLSKIWSKMSAFPSGGIKAAEAFKEVKVPLSGLRLGEEITLRISPDNDILEFDMKLPEGRAIKLIGNSQDGYEAKLSVQNILVKERTVSYPIFETFSESAQEVNVPVEIIDDLVDLFSGRLDFRELHPADSFSLIYEERTTESGERLSPGRIKAISIETNGKLHVAVMHAGKDNIPRYFDENGEQLGNGFLQYPLKFSRISSIFTKARFHPVLKTSRPHNGVDFAAPTGTPVRTVGDGVVEFAGYKKDTGNMIKIRHNDKYSTAYLHLSKISSYVRKGATIKRGEVIGAVGSTGMSTGPHLHFSLYENDQFVNPMGKKLPLITATGDAIPKTILASTMTILKQQHQLVRMASLITQPKSV